MNNWFSIESAPMDGSWILACRQGNHPVTGDPYVPAVVHYVDDIGWTERDDGYDDCSTCWELTHWQPLPTPPSVDTHPAPDYI